MSANDSLALLEWELFLQPKPVKGPKFVSHRQATTAMGFSKILSSSGGDSVRYFLNFCLHQKKYIVLLEFE
jgi:hypothetical protein